MAYNVLKGNVQFINSNSGSIESMVDDHSNQTIAGIKTFSGVLTASLGGTVGPKITWVWIEKSPSSLSPTCIDPLPFANFLVTAAYSLYV